MFLFTDSIQHGAVEARTPDSNHEDDWWKSAFDSVLTDTHKEQPIEQRCWQISHNNLEHFFKHILGLFPVSKLLSKSEIILHNDMRDSLHHLKLLIIEQSAVLQQLRYERNIVEEHEEKIQNGENFKYEIYITKRIDKKIANFVPLWKCCFCIQTCQQYNIANDGRCLDCPLSCPVEHHYNSSLISHLQVEETGLQLVNLRYKYRNISTEGEESIAQQLLVAIDNQCDVIEKCMRQMVVKSLQILTKVNSGQSLDDSQYLDLVIDEQVVGALPGWQGRIQVLESIKS